MARRTKDEAERTRAAVFDAAVQVFLARGVARASLDEVARAAGVTRGAVYWHFRDKLDLFLAIDAHARLPAEELLARLAAYQGPDPVGELAQALDECLTALEADPERRRLLTVVLVRCEYTEEMAPALERQRRADAALRTAFRQIFDRTAQVHGLVSAWRPEAAALALHTLLTGLLQNWLRGADICLAAEGVEVVRNLLASIDAGAR
ncbi:TetR family transcriptional regulator [Siccirubricoccus phaeus]|uniref:TetR family transcriptional regulator n=1 Tax=Siccirubricoccus phaeus TaxID=2595053 RepID=UPI00165A3F73|nr:TetR family transcriptional regulator [Siccirubricoccus phaeus]